MNERLKPIQVSGMLHAWRSPDTSFKHIFLKLDFSCEPDNYPGIVIVTDENCCRAVATAVTNLRKDLPQLLKSRPEARIAYWSLQQDVTETARILAGLTEHPTFVG